jgi:hypothetical protein
VKFILTLTSIPPRYPFLQRILANFETQTERPDGVQLYLPLAYRRFPGERPSLPPLPEWVEVIDCPWDHGPATKILFAVRAWRGRPVNIVYCDDDQLYDPAWLARFKALRRERPDDALCERGYHLEEISEARRTRAPEPRARRRPAEGKDLRYRAARALSLWQGKPPRHGFAESGYIDVAEGNGGVCIRPEWLDASAEEMPGVFWTVDDVWLSGHLAKARRNIWLNHEGFVQNALPGASKLEPLYQFRCGGVDRAGANRQCIAHLRKTCGVWI